MKKKLLLFFFLFLISFAAKSQKEDYVWRISSNGGIDFNKGFADTFSVNKLGGILWTNTSICDSSGKFLFYSEGTGIYNVNGDTLEGGDSLNPCHYTFTASGGGGGIDISGADIIIQRPNHPSQYYLFHETYDNDSTVPYYPYKMCNVLYQTIIDMTLDSGRGGVIKKNYRLYDNDTLLAGKLAAVRHANGTDWWLITRKGYAEIFYKWQISSDTIIGPIMQDNVPASFQHVYDNDGLGQACFSPDGSIYAAMYASNNLYVYSFDRCTGELGYIFNTHFNDANAIGMGCAFSSSGRFLYINVRWNIYQFDLWSGNIAASRTLVATNDGFLCPVRADFNQMKLAPDNKIYISTGNGCGSQTDYIHVIDYPDSSGVSCHVRQHSFKMPGGNAMSVPNIPNYRLGPLGVECGTSVNELASKINLVIYPNPLTSSSTLQLNTQLKDAEVVIYDMLGKEMVRKKLSGDRMEIERGSLESGVYFVRVREGERQWVEKVMIQ